MLHALDVFAGRALLLDIALRAEEPQLRLALLLRLAPPEHVEREPRVALGALQRTRAEHALKVGVGLVELRGERHEARITVAASREPIAERPPRDARRLRALPQRGADAPRADDGRGDLGGEGQRLRHQATSARTCAATERIRSGGTLLPMRSIAD